jgi:hypothetical protein
MILQNHVLRIHETTITTENPPIIIVMGRQRRNIWQTIINQKVGEKGEVLSLVLLPTLLTATSKDKKIFVEPKIKVDN